VVVLRAPALSNLRPTGAICRRTRHFEPRAGQGSVPHIVKELRSPPAGTHLCDRSGWLLSLASTSNESARRLRQRSWEPGTWALLDYIWTTNARMALSRDPVARHVHRSDAHRKSSTKAILGTGDAGTPSVRILVIACDDGPCTFDDFTDTSEMLGVRKRTEPACCCSPSEKNRSVDFSTREALLDYAATCRIQSRLILLLDRTQIRTSNLWLTERVNGSDGERQVLASSE
jgi:hypothetical protein